jgi:hypothetical protein
MSGTNRAGLEAKYLTGDIVSNSVKEMFQESM